MSKPNYYAFRRGHVMPALDFKEMRRLVAEACISFEQAGWFQKHLGKDCVDAPRDISALTLEKLGQDIWPLSELRELDEDWVLSAVEFLYLHSAKPTRSHNHDWSGCGIHVTSADSPSGRAAFRARMNGILSRYSTAYELRTDGEIWRIAPTGLEELEAETTGDDKIDMRVTNAISAFRRHGADEENKRQAVRDLADVLEYLRTTSGTALPVKDEGYLLTSPTISGSGTMTRSKEPSTTRGSTWTGSSTPT